jgi:hypothetical protein
MPKMTPPQKPVDTPPSKLTGLPISGIASEKEGKNSSSAPTTPSGASGGPPKANPPASPTGPVAAKETKVSPKPIDKSMFEGAGAKKVAMIGVMGKPHVRAATDDNLPSSTSSNSDPTLSSAGGRSRGVSMLPKMNGLPVHPSRTPGAGMERSASDGGSDSGSPGTAKRSARPTTMALGGAFASQLNAMIGKGPADKAKDPATFVTDAEPSGDLMASSSSGDLPKLANPALTRAKGRAGRRPPSRLMSASSSGAKPGDIVVPSTLGEDIAEENDGALGAGQGPDLSISIAVPSTSDE